MLARGAYVTYEPPVKTSGTESLLSILVNDTSHMLSQLGADDTKHILCDPTGRGLLTSWAWFPPDFAQASLPLLILLRVLSL